MANFQPPPTYAEVVLVDPAGKQPAKFNPIWLKWFLDLTRLLGPGGAASVQNVSVVTANGVSGTVANPTTTPAITLALGAIAPTVSVTSPIVKVTAAGGFKSSDNSAGFTGTVTTASLVGKTITIKDGIITGFA